MSKIIEWIPLGRGKRGRPDVAGKTAYQKPRNTGAQ